ncbi:hypothetical protein A6R68_20037, partial [Neotoma lepida]
DEDPSAWATVLVVVWLHANCKDLKCEWELLERKAVAWLHDQAGNSRAISYAGCVCQLFFYHFLGGTECFLYTVMAYDRFVAICYPLHYSVIMSHKLPYCGPKEVNYYFCDIPVVMKLACADTSALEMVGFISVGLMPLSCFFFILTSYSCIVRSILQIRSTEGRQRAFSTCSAHLTAILLFYMP